jgi:hypothetical protein
MTKTESFRDRAKREAIDATIKGGDIGKKTGRGESIPVQRNDDTSGTNRTKRR